MLLYTSGIFSYIQISNNNYINTRLNLVLQKQQGRAVIEISKLVHRHPANSAIWLILSHLLLKVVRHKKPSLSAAKCAEAAMKLGQNIMDVKKVSKTVENDSTNGLLISKFDFYQIHVIFRGLVAILPVETRVRILSWVWMPVRISLNVKYSLRKRFTTSEGSMPTSVMMSMIVSCLSITSVIILNCTLSIHT